MRTIKPSFRPHDFEKKLPKKHFLQINRIFFTNLSSSVNNFKFYIIKFSAAELSKF